MGILTWLLREDERSDGAVRRTGRVERGDTHPAHPNTTNTTNTTIITNTTTNTTTVIIVSGHNIDILQVRKLSLFYQVENKLLLFLISDFT